MSIDQPKIAARAGTLTAQPVVIRPERHALQKVLWFMRHKPLGAAGAIIVLLLILTAIFANQIAPYDYDAGKGTERFQGPSLHHLLGTDNIGRDMFSRIVYGARISVAVGFGAVIVGTGLATILGVISGYFGGAFDLFLQRIIDAWIAFPALVLLAFLVTVLSTRNTKPVTSIAIVAVALGLVVTGGSSRIVRGTVISVRDMPYMEAARCIGADHRLLIRRYIMPNILAPIIILATVQLGAAILAEATLSFLGFGVKPPMPAWGS